MSMRMKIFIVVCWFFFGLPLILFSIYASLNYSGFCFDEMRYLSDEEKIRTVFEMRNQQDTIYVKTEDRGWQRYEQVKYESFEQFMKMNPNCCALDPGGPYELPPPDFIDRITGYNSGEVMARKYTLYYLDENDRQIPKKYNTLSFISNCGRIKYWN